MVILAKKSVSQNVCPIPQVDSKPLQEPNAGITSAKVVSQLGGGEERVW